MKFSEFSDEIRRSEKYINWITEILQKDNYTCKLCGFVGPKYSPEIIPYPLNVDHIEPFSVLIVKNDIFTLEEAFSCEILWNKENARVVCRNCHHKTNTYGKKLGWEMRTYREIKQAEWDKKHA